MTKDQAAHIATGVAKRSKNKIIQQAVFHGLLTVTIKENGAGFGCDIEYPSDFPPKYQEAVWDLELQIEEEIRNLQEREKEQKQANASEELMSNLSDVARINAGLGTQQEIQKLCLSYLMAQQQVSNQNDYISHLEQRLAIIDARGILGGLPAGGDNFSPGGEENTKGDDQG